MPLPDLLDLGGTGPAIHLAPANGFPPQTYRRFAAALASHFHVFSLLPRPLWPGSDPRSAPTWRPLATDLVRGLQAVGLHGIAGVGHSIGGVLTLWAALERPDLFRAVVLVDPVILPPGWLRTLRFLRALHLADRQPLVQAALHRRRVFAGRAECYDHYRTKPLFVRWPDDILHDYVDAGTRERPDGSVELVYPPEWEAHIFATTPTQIWRDVPKLKTPALVLRGELSETFRLEAQSRMARLLPAVRFVTIGGAGHLLPMEKPEQTAHAIDRFLQTESLRIDKNSENWYHNRKDLTDDQP